LFKKLEIQPTNRFEKLKEIVERIPELDSMSSIYLLFDDNHCLRQQPWFFKLILEKTKVNDVKSIDNTTISYGYTHIQEENVRRSRNAALFLHMSVEAELFSDSGQDETTSTTTTTARENILGLIRKKFLGSSSENIHWSRIEIIDVANAALDLRKCNLSGLSKLSSVTRLDFTRCRIADHQLQYISSLTCLRTLSLNQCSQTGDVGLFHISKLTSLEHLDLSDCVEVTDASLLHLANLSTLLDLNVSKCRQLTDVGLLHISKIPTLRQLHVGYCHKVTNAGLQHLLNMPSLDREKVNINYDTAITKDGFAEFKKQLRENQQKKMNSSANAPQQEEQETEEAEKQKQLRHRTTL